MREIDGQKGRRPVAEALKGAGKDSFSLEMEIQADSPFDRMINRVRMRDVARRALWAAGARGRKELTLLVTDDETIQELNREYRGVDEATDVLAFSMENADQFISPPDAAEYLGDVVISYPRAEEQAAEHDHPVEREMDLLVAHGVLHLLGYDHQTEFEKAQMWAKQDEIIGLRE